MRRSVFVLAALSASVAAIVGGGVGATSADESKPSTPYLLDGDVLGHPAAAACGKDVVVYSPTADLKVLDSNVGQTALARAFIEAANERGVTWLSDPECEATDVASLTYSANWSGYATSATTTTPSDSQAEWSVPNVTNSVSGTTARVSMWPGLGGYGSTNLVQAGVESVQTYGQAQQNYFWKESLPAEATEVKVGSITVHNGDSVASQVDYLSGHFEWQLCDFTQSYCIDASQTAPAPGGTADFVWERPTVSGSFARLGNFGTGGFPFAIWGGSDGSVNYPTKGTQHRLDMTSNGASSGTLLSSTDDSGTSNSVTVHWHAYN